MPRSGNPYTVVLRVYTDGTAWNDSVVSHVRTRTVLRACRLAKLMSARAMGHLLSESNNQLRSDAEEYDVICVFHGHLEDVYRPREEDK